jgi:hypothetical protein
MLVTTAVPLLKTLPHDQINELIRTASDKDVLSRDPSPVSQPSAQGPALGVGIYMGELDFAKRLPDLHT